MAPAFNNGFVLMEFSISYLLV